VEVVLPEQLDVELLQAPAGIDEFFGAVLFHHVQATLIAAVEWLAIIAAKLANITDRCLPDIEEVELLV